MKTLSLGFMLSLNGMNQDVPSLFSMEGGKDQMHRLKSSLRDLVELKSTIKTFYSSNIDKIKNR